MLFYLPNYRSNFKWALNLRHQLLNLAFKLDSFLVELYFLELAPMRVHLVSFIIFTTHLLHLKLTLSVVHDQKFPVKVFGSSVPFVAKITFNFICWYNLFVWDELGMKTAYPWLFIASCNWEQYLRKISRFEQEQSWFVPGPPSENCLHYHWAISPLVHIS